MKAKALFAGLAVALCSALPAAAHETQYTTSLFGSSEIPPQITQGVGVALVTVDFDTLMMHVQAAFNGLTGTTTAAHIHCCVTTPGTNVGSPP